MKQTISQIAFLLLLLAMTRVAVAQGTNAPGRPDYQSFRIINDRNIFNPNRSAPGVRPKTSRHAKVESFTLVGTMSYDKGNFAFFDGTSSEFRKTVKPADTIAGYKIADITPKAVKLAAAGNQSIDLRVGMQMKREDGGPWSLIADAGPNTGASAEVGGDSQTPSDQTTGAAPGGDMSDIMKRLMQKRAEEK